MLDWAAGVKVTALHNVSVDVDDLEAVTPVFWWEHAFLGFASHAQEQQAMA